MEGNVDYLNSINDIARKVLDKNGKFENDVTSVPASGLGSDMYGFTKDGIHLDKKNRLKIISHDFHWDDGSGKRSGIEIYVKKGIWGYDKVFESFSERGEVRTLVYKKGDWEDYFKQNE